MLGISQRMPPANVQAEQALLGAILANNRNLHRCGELKPEHFSDPVHARIFERASKRIEAGGIADAVSLRDDFANAGVLDDVGGTAYLARLLSAHVANETVATYADTIRNCWLQRQLVDIGEAIVSLAFGADPDTAPAEVITQAAGQLLSLGEKSTIVAATSFDAALRSAVTRADAAHRGEAGQGRLDTGIRTVDDIWRGLWPGQLYYLMARSRTGKTPVMMQIVRNVARRLLEEHEATGAPLEHVHVFSLEMTAEDLAVINLAAVTRWCADDIRAGNIGGPADWMELERARAELARLPIIIDDQAEMDISALSMRARATKRTKRTRLICVDFAELIRRTKEHARMGLPEWIPYLGYQLKALAKAANVPVIALRQINKSQDSQEGRPQLRDLPYDGGQAADASLCLYRPELGMGEEPPAAAVSTGAVVSAEKQANLNSQWHARRNSVRGVAEFAALRRRFGPADVWKRLRFDGPRMTLSEIESGGQDDIPFPSEADYE